MKLRWNDKYITEYASSITWSGSASQASRTLEFSVAYNPYDDGFKNLNIKLADLIYFYDDGKCLFVGVVTSMERTGEAGTVSYAARDFMHYLLRSSGAYVFKNTKAEAIVKKICKDVKIKVGKLATTNTHIKSLIIQNDTYYNMIIRAYKKAGSNTGDKYIPVMDGVKLSVIPRGQTSGITLKESEDIISTSYGQNSDDMVNRVWILNDKYKKSGQVSSDKSIKKYGLYQSTYTKEKGVNAKKAAKKLLTGVTKTASISAIGNNACVSGYSVKLKDAGAGLTGKFYIESDSHTYENGTHTMTLELEWKNVMEDVSS